MSKNGSSVVGVISVSAVCALLMACVVLILGGSRGSEIGPEAIANAELNLENLFKSAQQNFIHRNGKMAASIEELGENFTIDSNGTIIYRDIWYARYGRPATDIPEESKQDDWEKKALSDPYRYAVLPVSGLATPTLDARTSVIVALPENENAIPALILVAGPIRRDPEDFQRKWAIKRVVTNEGCRMLRKQIDARAAYDKAFEEKLTPHFELL